MTKNLSLGWEVQNLNFLGVGPPPDFGTMIRYAENLYYYYFKYNEVQKGSIAREVHCAYIRSTKILTVPSFPMLVSEMASESNWTPGSLLNTRTICVKLMNWQSTFKPAKSTWHRQSVVIRTGHPLTATTNVNIHSCNIWSISHIESLKRGEDPT